MDISRESLSRFAGAGRAGAGLDPDEIVVPMGKQEARATLVSLANAIENSTADSLYIQRSDADRVATAIRKLLEA